MKVTLLSREYPPEVYGGAGVHVEYLARELSRLADVEVRFFGDPGAQNYPSGENPAVQAFFPWESLSSQPPEGPLLQVLSVNLAMASGLKGTDIVHTHTWYAGFAGHISKLLYGIPLVVTVHSLEPLRPWKSEQLGAGGYGAASFCERIAIESADSIIAVSNAMRDDVLRCYPQVDSRRVEVIHNGVDTDLYQPDPATDVLEKYGIDPACPYVLFVGRITRQKGISHLLDAAERIDSAFPLILCAGAADSPEIAGEVAGQIERLKVQRGNVVWINRALAKSEVIQLASHATVFCCPSVYEPLGIVNLEAMACGTAVVATAVGGIPEVVDDGVTGLLAPFEPNQDGSWGPKDANELAANLAERINLLLADPDLAGEFGRSGRRRVIDEFTWTSIAETTVKLYEGLAGTTLYPSLNNR
ncbi:MAG: glycogen synthase [Actinomycetota bacterium]